PDPAARPIDDRRGACLSDADFTRVAGRVRAQLRLPILSDLFALRRRGAAHAWRLGRRLAHVEAFAALHAVAPGRYRSRSAVVRDKSRASGLPAGQICFHTITLSWIRKTSPSASCAFWPRSRACISPRRSLS